MIVLDSSFLIAYHNSRDVHHAAASQVMDRLLAGDWGGALLPEYVFLEVTTVLAARRNLETAITVGTSLLQAREVEFVSCSEFFLETFDIFREQDATSLSFADASIVAIAQRRSAAFVATFDTDFRHVEGLNVIPA